jgi:hypothetical protein
LSQVPHPPFCFTFFFFSDRVSLFAWDLP